MIYDWNFYLNWIEWNGMWLSFSAKIFSAKKKKKQQIKELSMVECSFHMECGPIYGRMSKYFYSFHLFHFIQTILGIFSELPSGQPICTICKYICWQRTTDYWLLTTECNTKEKRDIKYWRNYWIEHSIDLR